MKKIFIDMMQREIEITFPPKRIVSVVPSQTELLSTLGLNDEVVGITKFCVHPESWFRTKERVGGTKKLNIEKIRELKPDLIIANREENERSQIEELAKDIPVWISDIQNIPQALLMLQAVGQLTGTEAEAGELVEDIVAGFTKLNKASIAKRVAYFVWYDPWMTVGGDTFISNMIETIGWKNVCKEKARYPEVSLEELRSLNPELVLLSSEPYPFKEKHVAEIKAVLRDADVRLVDGEMFSWYGSRMKKAVSYLENLVKA